MSDIYDELPEESERPYLEWSSLGPVDELRIVVESDPVAGPEHPVGPSDQATSEYSLLEMDATVTASESAAIDEGEYRLAISSSRLSRCLADHQVGAGDVIVLSWVPDGDYRDYTVEVVDSAE